MTQRLLKLCLLIIASMLCRNSYACGAESVEIDGVIYYLSSGKYSGYAAIIGCNKTGNVVIPKTIQYGCGDPECKDVHNFEVKHIAYGAFKENKNIYSVTFENGITEIECDYEAFSGCTALKEVNFPSSLLSLYGMDMFSGCTNLKSVILPDKLRIIGSSVFARSGLEEIYIPKSVEEIFWSAFDGCNDLKKVYIEDLNPWFDNEWGHLILTPGMADLYLNGSLFTDLEIPYGITKINDMAFMGCNSLKSITIPNTLKEIGGGAFDCCINLKSIIIDDGGDSIIGWPCTPSTSSKMSLDYIYMGRYWEFLFWELIESKTLTIGPEITNITTEFIAGFETVNLPSTMDSIGKRVFQNSNLKYLNVPCLTPPAIYAPYVDPEYGGDAYNATFNDYTYKNCILSVPILSAYKYRKAPGWENFFKYDKEELLAEYDDGVDISVDRDGNDIKLYGGGSCIFIPANDSITFNITIPEGEELDKVLFNDVDVTSQLVYNGTYYTFTTVAITTASSLKILLKNESDIEMIENKKQIEVARYDVHGRLLVAPKKGLNIIKMSDGTVRKEIVK